MKVVKWIGVGVAALLGIAVVVGLVRGNQWRVERTLLMKGPAQLIFFNLSDFRTWQTWTVWSGMDAEATWTFGGEPRHVGHWMQWQGPRIGRGKMTLTEVDPTKGIRYEGAIDSDESNATGSIQLAHLPQGIQVTWIDEGTSPPVIGGLLRGWLEGMLSEQFDKNLKQLDRVAEAQGKAMGVRSPQMSSEPPTAAPSAQGG